MRAVEMKGWLGYSLCVVLAAVQAGCGSQPFYRAPANLERPSEVALVCVDSDERPVPNQLCRDDSENHRLFALVLQSARGEVAAVDLATRTEIGRAHV